MTGTEIAAIAAGIGTILGAIGMPKIIEAWNSYRLSRDEQILELKAEVQDTKTKLSNIELKLSIIIPIVAKKNSDDPDVMQLLNALVDVSSVHKTPAPNND